METGVQPAANVAGNPRRLRGVVGAALRPEDFGQRFRVLDTVCTETSYARFAADLAAHCLAAPRRCLAVDFTNVHIVAMRHEDDEFRRITDSMDLFIPDSMVLTWAVNWQGGEMRDRVYGPSFLAYMIEHSPPDLRHYFLGASQKCLDQLIEQTARRNPDFQLVGSHHGYFGEDDEEAVLEKVNAAKPDIVWVGLGTPKQQEWIDRFHQRTQAGALLAVGFAFDVNAGTKKDAPLWMQPIGLTWLHRLLQEPRRLWRRYLHYNTTFLRALIQDQMGFGPHQAPEPEVVAEPAPAAAPPSQPGAVARPPRCSVLGVGINAMDLGTATRLVTEGADTPGLSGFVTVTGVHGVMESMRDRELRMIHNRSFLSTPDGMPMVWIGKWSGFDDIDRVYGPDLMEEVVRNTAGTRRGHYFWGGNEGIATELGQRMAALFPGTEVVGTVSPPFGELGVEEEDELAKSLQETKPHFLWVGLSTPKQERFMSGFLERHPDLVKGWPHGLVLLGVGAAFDFHSGRLEQAPLWMQRRGLEWLFRLCMEPRRLWRRYSINNTGFVFAILPQLMKWKKYPLEK